MNHIFQIHNFKFDFEELKNEIKEITRYRSDTKNTINWTQFSLQSNSPDKKGIKYSQDAVGKAKGKGMEEWECSFVYPLFDAPIINTFINHF